MTTRGRLLLPGLGVVALLLAAAALQAGLDRTPGESFQPPFAPDADRPFAPLDERLPFLAPPPRPARFLAWGDAGHGNDVQYSVAAAAERVCAAEGCGFALQLGDNFYPRGVRDAEDPQFEHKFERPYANLSLPFYAALGNHDVDGTGAPGLRDNGDFQVRRSQLDDDAPRWTMPARHYAFREGDVQVVVLDLTALAGTDADLAREAAQLAWLDGVWDPGARWHVAVSHFPYVSNGKHGDAGRYEGIEGRGAAIARLVEEKVCPHADLYLSGHDHDLEWLKPTPACGKTEFVVSGAAADPRPLRREPHAPAWFSLGDAPGFFWFEAEGERLTGRAYGADGALLFERTLRKG